MPRHLIAPKSDTLGRVALAVALAATVAGAQPTPADARAKEQDVAAVRTVYQDVTRAVAAGRLTRRDTTIACGEEDLGQDVTLWRDRARVVRHLHWVAGSDDHSQTHRSYYDTRGRLRFVFVTRGAVNGTKEEVRLYYGPTGTLVRRLEKRMAGPGYPFGEPEPVRSPTQWLRQQCSAGS